MSLSEWKEYKFSDLGEIKTGKTPPNKAGNIWGNSIQFITPTDISNQKYITQTNRGLSDLGLDKVKTCFLPKGSIIVTCIGSDMGKVVINKDDCVTNQQINSIIIDKNNFSVDYIYYNFSTRKDEFFNLASGGSTMPILNKTAFSNLKIKLPPLPEQQAIAEVLGSLDDKIELNRQMNKTLEDMAQAIFKSWFVDFDPVKAKAEGRTIEGLSQEILDLFPDSFEPSELGEIPKGWTIEPLSKAYNIFDSKRIPLSSRQREERKGPYPYYGAASIMDYVDDYIFDGVYFLMGEDGSVINDDGTPVTQYAWGKIWVNNHAHVLQGKDFISTEHLMIYLKQTNIKPYVTGAVQLKINQSNLGSIPFVMPDETICNYFNEVIQPCFEKIRKNTEEIQILSNLRDTLLPKLISGELRIPDAEKLVEGTI